MLGIIMIVGFTFYFILYFQSTGAIVEYIKYCEASGDPVTKNMFMNILSKFRRPLLTSTIADDFDSGIDEHLAKYFRTKIEDKRIFKLFTKEMKKCDKIPLISMYYAINKKFQKEIVDLRNGH